MVFWRKAKDEERPTTQEPLLLHHKIQTQFSDIFHRLTGWKVMNDDHALSVAEIKSRMAGIPMYMLSNYSECESVIFSLADPKRRLQLNFFSKPDALDYFERMKLLDDSLTKEHWRIFDAPLSDVIVSEDEDPIRLVPESSQIKHALEENKKKNLAADNFFSGVPVFKCDNLTFKIQKRGNTGFRPVYLRKEDLQDTITALDIMPGNIEVASFEEIIQGMKDSSTNESNDFIFVGPGDTTNWLKA